MSPETAAGSTAPAEAEAAFDRDEVYESIAWAALSLPNQYCHVRRPLRPARRRRRRLTDDGVYVFRLARGGVGRPLDVEELAGAERERERLGEVAQVVVHLGRDEGSELPGWEGGVL